MVFWRVVCGAQPSITALWSMRVGESVRDLSVGSKFKFVKPGQAEELESQVSRIDVGIEHTDQLALVLHGWKHAQCRPLLTFFAFLIVCKAGIVCKAAL